MVRWKYSMSLVMILLLTMRISTKAEDDEEEEPDENENDDEDSDDEDNDEDEDDGVKDKKIAHSRKPSPYPSFFRAVSVTRTVKRRPLECFVCSYKSETPLRACLDPTKYRVHTVTCHSTEDKCFTSVISKGQTYEVVVRGCRSACVGTPDTTCCTINRCNNQAFAIPVPTQPRVMLVSHSTKPIPPTVFYFVTILLILQTVAKVPSV